DEIDSLGILRRQVEVPGLELVGADHLDHADDITLTEYAVNGISRHCRPPAFHQTPRVNPRHSPITPECAEPARRRPTDYESEGRRFESCWARQFPAVQPAAAISARAARADTSSFSRSGL